MRVLRIAIVAAALDILLSSCSALLCGPDIAHAPAADYFGPAVRDSEAAIIIARAVWLSRHPELENESEVAWLNDYKAELWGGAWYVSRSDGKGTGPLIQIARRDGHLLDVAPVQ